MCLQFSSIKSLSPVRLFATPWTAARQASLSITNSRSLLKLMSIERVMPSNHLILCRPLLLLLSIFSSITIDWFDLLAIQGTLKRLLQHHSSKASVLHCSTFFYCPAITSVHDYWKNHSFDYIDLYQQSNVSDF